ncbi:MAG: peptidase dimerization protein, partial [Terriglobales bacterium]
MSPVNLDLFALARKLVDIESTTPNEVAVGEFLRAELADRGFDASKMPADGERSNVMATWPGHPRPEVVFST